MVAYITRGLPASGKSTWAKNFARTKNYFGSSNPITIINNDNIRNDIYLEAGNRNWSKDVEKRVKEIREDKIREQFQKGLDVILDNTHLNPKTFEAIKNYCTNLGYKIEIMDFSYVPLEECIRRDSLRRYDEKVGESVIRKMYNNFMSPTKPHDRNLPGFVPNPNLLTCIIVDIDGTLAKMKDRGPYEESKVYQDDVRLHVLETIRALSKKVDKIFIFTGRSRNCLTETISWLNDKCLFYVDNHWQDNQKDMDGVIGVQLHMRGSEDRRRDSLVKMDMFDNFVKDKYNVMVVFDDRPQVIRECWNMLNVPVFNCGIIDVEF
jgi:predicted kinase